MGGGGSDDDDDDGCSAGCSFGESPLPFTDACVVPEDAPPPPAALSSSASQAEEAGGSPLSVSSFAKEQHDPALQASRHTPGPMTVASESREHSTVRFCAGIGGASTAATYVAVLFLSLIAPPLTASEPASKAVDCCRRIDG